MPSAACVRNPRRSGHYTRMARKERLRRTAGGSAEGSSDDGGSGSVDQDAVEEASAALITGWKVQGPVRAV